MYKPCQFDREEYLEGAADFEAMAVEYADDIYSEQNGDAECLAIELSYTRYRVAKLEKLIRVGIDSGYITLPEEGSPARETIDEIRGVENEWRKF